MTEANVGDVPQEEKPVRVEIKDNAKGEVQVSVRVTGEDATETMQQAVNLYVDTKRQVG